MKKATAAVLIFSMLFICSCNNGSKPQEICINRVFCAKMTLEYNETAFTADFTCDENGCSAVFLSPDELKGFTVSTTGSRFTLSLDGLEQQVTENEQQTIVIGAVYAAINSAGQSAQRLENGYQISGTNKYGRYIMNIDEDFTPAFIEYEECGITVKFTADT